LSGRQTPDSGEVLYIRGRGEDQVTQLEDLYLMAESQRRQLLRTEWGVVHQHPMDGLRGRVSAGGNIGERLMAVGERHYG
ncbi:phosphonate C-P lyase system protein PhnK, partial [Vibrio alfacsensis]